MLNVFRKKGGVEYKPDISKFNGKNRVMKITHAG